MANHGDSISKNGPMESITSCNKRLLQESFSFSYTISYPRGYSLSPLTIQIKGNEHLTQETASSISSFSDMRLVPLLEAVSLAVCHRWNYLRLKGPCLAVCNAK